MTYTGKQFEQDFKESFEPLPKNVTLLRLYDTTNGFRGIHNPCDFILGTKYGTIYVELKTTKGASLSFRNITDAQWADLSVADYSNYTHCGILVYFQAYDKVYWYPISQLFQLRKAGAKSINPTNFTHLGYPVPHVKKRVRIRLNFNAFVGIIGQGVEDLNGKS